MRTAIKTTQKTLDRLDQLKLTRGESYENVILRLLQKHEGVLMNELGNTYDQTD